MLICIQIEILFGLFGGEPFWSLILSIWCVCVGENAAQIYSE